MIYVSVDDLVPYGDFYKVTAEVAPAQIGDTVVITIVEADGSTTTYSTSIAEYCEYLIANYDDEKVVALAKATLEYGRTANDYFADIGFYYRLLPCDGDHFAVHTGAESESPC